MFKGLAQTFIRVRNGQSLMYICNIALAHYHVRMYSAHVVCKRIFYIQTNLQMLQHLNIYAMLQNDVFW